MTRGHSNTCASGGWWRPRGQPLLRVARAGKRGVSAGHKVARSVAVEMGIALSAAIEIAQDRRSFLALLLARSVLARSVSILIFLSVRSDRNRLAYQFPAIPRRGRGRLRLQPDFPAHFLNSFRKLHVGFRAWGLSAWTDLLHIPSGCFGKSRYP